VLFTAGHDMVDRVARVEVDEEPVLDQVPALAHARSAANAAETNIVDEVKCKSVSDCDNVTEQKSG
jgi:hypothetical protein